MSAPRLPLDRAQVLRAALALVDEEGLAALSMRRLGSRLGVQAMSLYEHVSDKEGVLDGLVELLVGEIDVPDPDAAAWADVLRGSAHSYRAVAHRHPWAFVLMATRQLVSPVALARFETALDAVRRSGFSPATAAVAFVTIESFTSGFALGEVSGAHEVNLSALDRRDFPLVAELDAQVARDGPDDLFEAGLEAVIDGLGRLRDPSQISRADARRRTEDLS